MNQPTLERLICVGSVARHVAAYFDILKTIVLEQVGQAEIDKQSSHYSYLKEEENNYKKNSMLSCDHGKDTRLTGLLKWRPARFPHKLVAQG